MLITIIATVVVLGVLIFVHELGHFITAKLADIEVPRFSIGLGPKLWGFRRGETEYVISWLPLGGYVRMAGMDELERIEGGRIERRDVTGAGVPSDAGLVTEAGRKPGPRDFESKSLGARMLVISAGVIMNVLFAFVVFAAIASIWGIRQVPEARVADVAEAELPEGAEALAGIPAQARITAIGDDEIEDWEDLQRALASASPGPTAIEFERAPAITVELPEEPEARSALIGAIRPRLEPVLGSVVEGLPAARAGLQAGDRIVEADGQPVDTWLDLVTAVESHPGTPLELAVQRDGRIFDVTVTPDVREDVEPGSGVPAVQIGVSSQLPPRERPGLFGAIVHGAAETWDWISLTVGFLVDLIVGDTSPRNLGGPILIGQVSGEVARAGAEELLNFMAILSINLAVLNLLPIPVLDGGWLVFLGVEAVRGRALSLEQRMRLTQVGFVIVLAIMVWAIANDVLRLFGI